MIKLFAALLCAAMFPSKDESLKISVNNVKIGKGSIVVEIYDKHEYFFKKSVAKKIVKATDKNLDVSFDIPQGTYAIAIYQDENENKLFDRNFLGLPKEPYGLSNNFKPRFAAPTFNDCKFNVAQATSLSISLR
jgi:uncharacterized protein (DUF2141 family)